MDVLLKLANCKNVRVLGTWTDPDGVYPPMPLFELDDMTAEEWNRMGHGKERGEFNEAE